MGRIDSTEPGLESNARSFKTTTGTAAAPAKEPISTDSPDSDREGRIARLREQVLNGTYKVDVAELSARIIQAHLDK